MKCLETRATPDALKRRRYRLDDGRSLHTMELPTSVIRAIGARKVRECMAVWRRGEKQRERAQRLRDLVAQGIKPTAIAHILGVTEQRVRQVRKVMEP